MRNTNPSSCPAGCPGCASNDSGEGLRAWVAAHEQAAGKSLAGPGLLARAAGVFVLPVVGALTGAILAGPGELRRFVGMTVGLLAAMALAAGVAAACRRRTNPTPDAGEPPTQA